MKLEGMMTINTAEIVIKIMTFIQAEFDNVNVLESLRMSGEEKKFREGQLDVLEKANKIIQAEIKKQEKQLESKESELINQ